MGFSIGRTINGAVEWVGSAPLISTVMNNPFYTALLLTALVAVVGLALYGAEIRASSAKTTARAAVYVFLASAAVLYIHHTVVHRAAQRSAASEGVRNIFSGIQASRTINAGESVPVIPEVVGGARPDNVAASDLVLQDVRFSLGGQ